MSSSNNISNNNDFPSLLFNSHTCANCGKSATAAAGGEGGGGHARLYLCHGCEKVGYCGRSCQKADWRRQHRELCQHVLQVYPAGSNRLCVNYSTNTNSNNSKPIHADAVLEYAAKHMGANLQHVTLHISPLSSTTGQQILTAKQLTSFLERTQHNLVTLAFTFDKDTPQKRRAVQSFTDHGKAFLPLALHTKLQKLDLEHASFNDVKDLCRSLPPHLHALALDGLELGYGNHSQTWNASTGAAGTTTAAAAAPGPWPATAARTLAHCVSQRLRATLRSLSLRESCLVDADVHPFLSGLRRLTSLAWTPQPHDRGSATTTTTTNHPGGLTDAGLAVIASYYDTRTNNDSNTNGMDHITNIERQQFGLQSLDLSGHTQATLMGVQTLLRACGATLRELHCAGLALHASGTHNTVVPWDGGTAAPASAAAASSLVVLGLDERQWHHPPLQQWVRASRGRLGCLVQGVGWTDYSELLLVDDNNIDDDNDDNTANQNAMAGDGDQYGDAETVHTTLEARWELWRTVHERRCNREFVNGSEWDGL